MASKSEIADRLRKRAGADFINRKELAESLGYKDPHYVDRYLNGLTRIGTKYFVDDVALVLAGEMK